MFICIVSVYLYVYAMCIHLHGIYVHNWKLYQFCVPKKCCIVLSNVVLTNDIPQVDKAKRLRREYSTCIGRVMFVGRRRIRGTRSIVHIVSF